MRDVLHTPCLEFQSTTSNLYLDCFILCQVYKTCRIKVIFPFIFMFMQITIS